MDILELLHGNGDIASRRFACTQLGCPKAFNRKSDLARHARIHANDRPYACEWEGCTKAFIQRSALTVHTRVHTGERPHACIVKGCNKAFGDSSSLARHRRVHTGARPYQCTDADCDKTFCRKITLTKHMRRHHPYATPLPPINPRPGNQQHSYGTPLFSPVSSVGSPCPSSPLLYREDRDASPTLGLGITISSPTGGPSFSVPPPEAFPRSTSALSHHSGYSAPSLLHSLTVRSPQSSLYSTDSGHLPPSPADSGIDLRQYSDQHFNLPVNKYTTSLPPLRGILPSIPSPFRWSESGSQGLPPMPMSASSYPYTPRPSRDRFERLFDESAFHSPVSPVFSRFTTAAINDQPIPSPTFSSYFSLSSPTYQKAFKPEACKPEVWNWSEMEATRRASNFSSDGFAAFSHEGDVPSARF